MQGLGVAAAIVGASVVVSIFYISVTISQEQVEKETIAAQEVEDFNKALDSIDPDNILLGDAASLGDARNIMLVVGPSWLTQNKQQQTDLALQAWQLWDSGSTEPFKSIALQTEAGQELGWVYGASNSTPTVEWH